MATGRVSGSGGDVHRINQLTENKAPKQKAGKTSVVHKGRQIKATEPTGRLRSNRTASRDSGYSSASSTKSLSEYRVSKFQSYTHANENDLSEKLGRIHQEILASHSESDIGNKIINFIDCLQGACATAELTPSQQQKNYDQMTDLVAHKLAETAINSVDKKSTSSDKARTIALEFVKFKRQTLEADVVAQRSTVSQLFALSYVKSDGSNKVDAKGLGDNTLHKSTHMDKGFGMSSLTKVDELNKRLGAYEHFEKEPPKSKSTVQYWEDRGCPRVDDPGFVKQQIQEIKKEIQHIKGKEGFKNWGGICEDIAKKMEVEILTKLDEIIIQKKGKSRNSWSQKVRNWLSSVYKPSAKNKSGEKVKASEHIKDKRAAEGIVETQLNKMLDKDKEQIYKTDLFSDQDFKNWLSAIKSNSGGVIPMKDSVMFMHMRSSVLQMEKNIGKQYQNNPALKEKLSIELAHSINNALEKNVEFTGNPEAFSRKDAKSLIKVFNRILNSHQLKNSYGEITVKLINSDGQRIQKTFIPRDR